jgi:glycogen synthase
MGTQASPLDWIGRDTIHGQSGESTSTWLQTKFPDVWGKKIKPIGRVDSDEWSRRLHQAKAVLVPSLWDTFNLVAAEAMAVGKVVVVSNGAGAVDLIEHGVNGFVFPKGDAVALAETIQHVEKLTKNERTEIGQRAAATISEKLDPERIATEKLKLYHKLPPKGDENSWLRDILFPETHSTPLAFLDGLPLKDLTDYVARRAAKKVLGRIK